MIIIRGREIPAKCMQMSLICNIIRANGTYHICIMSYNREGFKRGVCTGRFNPMLQIGVGACTGVIQAHGLI